MYHPLPHLPRKFQAFIRSLKTLKIPNGLVVFTIGLLATVWFLIRVIPKPSRAAYPCMQATAPFMAGFVVYLSSLAGSVWAFGRFRRAAASRVSIVAVLFLLVAVSLFLTSLFQFPSVSFAKRASAVRGFFPPNEPIGIARGIFPGRVVWMWDKDATNQGCTNTSNGNGIIDSGDDAWFMSKNNDQAVIDSMLIKSMLALTGTADLPSAWEAVFRFYNNDQGNGDSGYETGQKVFIKVNATTAYGGISTGRYYADLSRNDNLTINDFAAETNPFLVVSMLRQLVYEAGVPQNMIYVGDPARNIYKEFFDLWKSEFPDINVLGNNLLHPELQIEALGRLPVTFTANDKVFYSDNGTVMPAALSDKLFTIFEEMDYLINIPTLKAHATAGITLNAKNHFGSFPRTWAMHLHPGLFDNADDPIRLGYGLYRIQTDIMMHELLSGKNLLMIVDGLFPGEDALGVPFHWQSIPFEGDWCSSIFLSLDPVAIESVCHDFLRTEYNGPTVAQSRPNWDGVDDYLHQAADQSLWPDGVVYDPDNNGVLIASLGVHEHWNDSLNKAYSRNLGIGDGIELVKAHEWTVGIVNPSGETNVEVYPNPASDRIYIRNTDQKRLTYELLSASGQRMMGGTIDRQYLTSITITHLPGGIYFLNTNTGRSFKIIKE
jgi:hypothetical protein